MLNNCIYICVAARIYRYNCLAVTYVNFRQNSELFFIIPKVLKFKYHNVSFLDGFIQQLFLSEIYLIAILVANL